MPKRVNVTGNKVRELFDTKLTQFRRRSHNEIIDCILSMESRRMLDFIFMGFVPKINVIDKRKVPKNAAGFVMQYVYEVTYKIPSEVRKHGENDVVISVWFLSTLDDLSDQPRNSGRTLIMITDSRMKNPVYWSFDIHMTAGYLDTCENYLKAEVERVNKWPLCKECMRPLPLLRVKPFNKEGNIIEENLFRYYFRICPCCHPKIKKGEKYHESFYIYMDEEHANFLRKMHERYAKQRKKSSEKTGKQANVKVLQKSQRNKMKEGLHYENVYNDGEAPE